MAMTNVSFKTEDGIKIQVEEIFSTLGLDMSSGLNLLLRTLIREGGTTLGVESTPSEEYVAWMKAELAKSWERRNDPDTKWYKPDEFKARHNL